MPTGSGPAQVRNGYVEVDVLENAGGALAVFTRRNGSHLHTVSFFKTYERDGEKTRTSFFSLKNLDALEEMIKTARKEIMRREEIAKAEMKGGAA